MSFNRVIRLNYTILAVIVALVFTASCLGLSIKSRQVAATPQIIDLPVVMYHHVLKSKQGDYIVSPTQLEQDLSYIKSKGYQTVSITELVAFLENGTPLPKNPILITFDDGYESVYEYAFPLLKKYNMNAVISIIGKHTDIFSNPDETKSINYSHLSWDELREMKESGVFEIGNHSYDMHDNCDDKRYGIRKKQSESSEQYLLEIEKDIGGLSAQIEKEIGIKPTVFAYPFGALCKESVPLLDSLGIKIYLTCEEKVNKIETGTEFPVSLKRFNRAAKYDTAEYFAKLGID